MSDVYIAFGSLLSLGIVFPGLLITCWLLFPGPAGRAEERLMVTPGRCFLFGAGLTGLFAVPILILLNLAVPFASILGAVLIALVLVVALVGGTGLAGLLAGRLNDRAGQTLSPAGAFLRAAIALELAAAFPVLGWFMLIPLATLVSLGAGVFALLHWRPRVRARVQVVARPAGASDVS